VILTILMFHLIYCDSPHKTNLCFLGLHIHCWCPIYNKTFLCTQFKDSYTYHLIVACNVGFYFFIFFPLFTYFFTFECFLWSFFIIKIFNKLENLLLGCLLPNKIFSLLPSLVCLLMCIYL